jgi:hypothetical protein
VAEARPPRAVAAAVSLATLLAPRAAEPAVQHTPPASFAPGEALHLDAVAPAGITRAYLRYRHLDQAERWAAAPMEIEDAHEGVRVRGTIPAADADTPFPLQYRFELHASSGAAWRWPGIGSELDRQPYLVVRRP